MAIFLTKNHHNRLATGGQTSDCDTIKLYQFAQHDD